VQPQGILGNLSNGLGNLSSGLRTETFPVSSRSQSQTTSANSNSMVVQVEARGMAKVFTSLASGAERHTFDCKRGRCYPRRLLQDGKPVPWRDRGCRPSGGAAPPHPRAAGRRRRGWSARRVGGRRRDYAARWQPAAAIRGAIIVKSRASRPRWLSATGGRIEVSEGHALLPGAAQTACLHTRSCKSRGTFKRNCAPHALPKINSPEAGFVREQPKRLQPEGRITSR
jgi:hypothetical protein